MELTENQKNFLLDNFFKNDDYTGWKNIASKLLTNGKCVVAGNDCIWEDGIGNYIKTTRGGEYIGCLLYEFELESFLSSVWYKQIHIKYLVELGKQKEAIELKYKELTNLI